MWSFFGKPRLLAVLALCGSFGALVDAFRQVRPEDNISKTEAVEPASVGTSLGPSSLSSAYSDLPLSRLVEGEGDAVLAFAVQAANGIAAKANDLTPSRADEAEAAAAPERLVPAPVVAAMAGLALG
eukprot:TRINITY_DN49822_c0_g1_i1.p1 TRINITY_DN49822_c0_g1~~TRINITY_DN49822_c0_g1_i1.p1  ORF type:complete len:127 (+),score=25.76 TRINITY_DN49822_c0_g1_i1:109-489(+)